MRGYWYDRACEAIEAALAQLPAVEEADAPLFEKGESQDET
jgi:hypothetical protein